jgi:cell division protein FtsI/penicillin-binding protein 2
VRSRGWGFKVGIAVVVAALLGVGVWGGLSLRGGDTDAARLAADRVATGLEQAKLAPGAVVAEGDAPDLAALVTGMGKATQTVTVASMTEPEDGAARATLRHVWTLPGAGAQWSYETPLELRKGDARWAGVWNPAMVAPGLVAGETLSLQRRQPDRAPILGAGGTPIVQPRKVYRIGIDKTKTSGSEAVTSARVLAAALDIDVDNFVSAVEKAGPRAFVEALTARVGSPQESAARAVDAPGVHLVQDERMLAPTSTFARPILGVVGDATAEIVEKSEGKVVAGDTVGIGGVQAAFNDQLAGQPGYAVLARGGPTERTLFTTEPTPGTPVTLTLDVATQEAAESVLAPVEPASAIVAIQPSTGHVLAAASGPGGNGTSTATQSRSAPGSTFKTVSTLALLRSGLTPSSTVECSPTVTVDGRSFKNVTGFPASALGSVPFSSAFAHSCNTAFISAGEKLAPTDLPAAAAALGLTAQAALGVPAFLGSVPEPKPGTEQAASMIGQGKVLASPLGMATVAASIGAGRTVTPSLVVDAKTPAPQAPDKPVTAAEAAQIRTLMRGVVEDGSATFLLDVPGAPVVAKTGTAEFGEAGALKEHAWMIAIQGDLAVAVFVEEGTGGASTAGPLLEKFLRAVA